MAADGAAETQLSRIGSVLYQFTGDGNGAYQFRTAAGALSGIAVGDVVANFDGSRRFRVRYDTRDFNGFSAAAAHGYNALDTNPNEDYFTDIALRYAGEFGDVEVEAGIGYQIRDRFNSADTTSWIASGAVMLPSGLSFAAGIGAEEDDRPGQPDPGWYYGQIAFDRDVFGFGTTSFGVDYYSGSDFGTTGSSSESWGIGILQQIKPINADVYLTYRKHAFDELAADYRDMNSWLLGTRIRF